MTCRHFRICARPPSRCRHGGGIGYDFSDASAQRRAVSRAWVPMPPGPLPSWMCGNAMCCRTHHERRLSPRRDDGNDCVANNPESRPSSKQRHERAGAMFNLSVSSPTRHDRDQRGRALGAELQQADLQVLRARRAVGQDHARDFDYAERASFHRPLNRRKNLHY